MQYTLNGTYTSDDVVRFIASMEAIGYEWTGLDPNTMRDDGTMVQRIELHNQPKFKGLCGPMWDGDKIRYETWEVYEALSR
jgi:hypothetical protein